MNLGMSLSDLITYSVWATYIIVTMDKPSLSGSKPVKRLSFSPTGLTPQAKASKTRVSGRQSKLIQADLQVLVVAYLSSLTCGLGVYVIMFMHVAYLLVYLPCSSFLSLSCFILCLQICYPFVSMNEMVGMYKWHVKRISVMISMWNLWWNLHGSKRFVVNFFCFYYQLATKCFELSNINQHA